MITALDIGTTKVICLMARPLKNHKFQILGFGHQINQGMRLGTIIDMDKVERAILKAVHAAEKMADMTVDKTIIGLSGGGIDSQHIHVDMPISGKMISDHDGRRLLQQARSHSIGSERYLLHSIPLHFSVDQQTEIDDPIGMSGRRLGMHMHLVSTSAVAVNTMNTAVERCHLEVSDMAFSAYAAGLACLVEDERQLGVTLIEMGGGTTTIAVFHHNKLVYVNTIPVGAHHITKDIARGLSTTIDRAEQLKMQYGSTLVGPNDDREMISVPVVGVEGPGGDNIISRSLLVGIIKPRVEETFELIQDCLRRSGFGKIAGQRVVLSGGGSLLHGVQEFAGNVLGSDVRLGHPLNMFGDEGVGRSPIFAHAAGLLAYSGRQQDAQWTSYPNMLRGNRKMQGKLGVLGRFGMWLKENF